MSKWNKKLQQVKQYGIDTGLEIKEPKAETKTEPCMFENEVYDQGNILNL